MKSNCTKYFFIIFSIYFLLSTNCFAQNIAAAESNMGVTKEMFSDINIRDARATMEVWAKIVHESYTKVENAKTTIFNDPETLISAINNEEIDVIFLNSIQYLQNINVLNIKPYFGTTVNKKKFFSLFLLTNNKEINKFSDLKEKKSQYKPVVIKC